MKKQPKPEEKASDAEVAAALGGGVTSEVSIVQRKYTPSEHVVRNEDGEIEHVGGSYVKANVEKAKEDKDDILSSIVPGNKKASLAEKK